MNRVIPEHLVERITRRGGLAVDGQPLFRVIHNLDRLTTIGGDWAKHDEHGNVTGHEVGYRQVVKYHWLRPEDCFVFEVLMPADYFGTREQFEEKYTQYIRGHKIEEMGSYPENGEYELMKALITPKGHAVQELTPTMCDAMVDVAVKNRSLPESAKIAFAQENRKKAEVARIVKQAAMIDDLGRPEFAYGPYVTMPSEYDIKKFS